MLGSALGDVARDSSRVRAIRRRASCGSRTGHARDRASGASHVRVGGGVEVLALCRELFDQPAQLGHAGFGGADRQTVLAAGVAAGLSRVEPILHGSREQAIRDVPQVGLVVAVCDLVAEVDGTTEGLVERFGVFDLRIGGHVGKCSQETSRNDIRLACLDVVEMYKNCL